MGAASDEELSEDTNDEDDEGDEEEEEEEEQDRYDTTGSITGLKSSPRGVYLPSAATRNCFPWEDM